MSGKQPQVERFLGDVLAKMAFAARIEVKELEEKPATEEQPAIPSSLSVAVFPEGDFPGLTAGKRTPVVEALQFLANKVVNRGPEKQWVNVGVGGHPEPRVPGGKKEKQKQKGKAQPAEATVAAERPERAEGGERQARAERPEKAPRGDRSERPERGERGGRGERKKERKDAGEQPVAARAPRGRDGDEASLEVAEDPALSEAGLALARNAAELGRIYAVTAMSAEDRARLLKAAEQVDFIRGKVEGEGRHRRVVFMPANPKPMPKKSHMPDYDDEDEDGEE